MQTTAALVGGQGGKAP